jgi:hypothetical protein
LQQLPLCNYKLELVDVLISPDKAKEFGVFATPTLIKESPEPLRRVVGKLDDAESAVMAIDLIKVTASNPVKAIPASSDFNEMILY